MTVVHVLPQPVLHVTCALAPDYMSSGPGVSYLTSFQGLLKSDKLGFLFWQLKTLLIEIFAPERDAKMRSWINGGGAVLGSEKTGKLVTLSVWL